MIDAATVKHLFPFSVWVDENLTVGTPGRTLEDLFKVQVGTPFEDAFEFLRQESPLSPELLNELVDSPIQIRMRSTGVILMGQVAPALSGFLFLLTPRLPSVEELSPLGLKINHFAPHDGVMTSLFQLQQTEVTAAEAISAATDLVKQQSVYRQIVEQSNDLILGLHPDLGVTFANPAARMLLGLEELPTPFTDVFDEDASSKLSSVAERLNAGAESAWVELSATGARGGTLQLDGSIATSAAAEHTGPLLGFFRDVTEKNIVEQELRKSNEQLREAQKMEAIGRFAGGIAHDFNNILGVISSAGDLLQADLSQHDPRLKDVETIISTAEKGAALARQLLQFSRQRPKVEGRTDLYGHIESMREAFSLILNRGVKLHTPAPENRCWAGIAPIQLEQILMNLVVNASNAMPSGGSIHITVEEQEEHVVLCVRDTGTGMPPEVVQRIFEPFYSTNQQKGGSGLGLSVVYGILDEAGGKIEVDSVPGDGSTFRVTLPRVEGEEASDAPEDRQAPPETREVVGRVVLVEDQPDLRRLISRALEGLGLEVVAFEGMESAEVGIQAYEGIPDLFITDIALGDGNGLDLAEHLLTNGQVERVLITTGNADFDRVEDLTSRHGCRVLMKPFRIRQLYQLVGEILSL